MIASSKRKSFLNLFPVPEFLLLSSTGVSITDKDTKFVQLKKSFFKDRFELIHATKINNPEGSIERGLINNQSKLTPILKKLASHYGVRYVHAVLPEERAYLFTTTINWTPKDGLRDAVAFIIEENVPVTLAESVFDFEIINEDKDAGKIKIAVSVLASELVNSYFNLFESAGLVPVSFNLESQSAVRASILYGDKNPYLIINLSSKKTGLYIVEDEIVQFSTTSAYNISEDNSHSNINDLKAEIRKVIAFWNVHSDKTNNSSGLIQKAIVGGPNSFKKDYIKELMEGSNIEYSIADSVLNLSSNKHLTRMTNEDSLDYVLAIGAVLSSIK